MQPKKHTREFLRDEAYLRPRTNLFQAVFRVRSVAAYAIHKYFQDNGYVYFHAPLITASDCEGAGQMFQVTTLDLEKVKNSKKVDYTKDFFGKQASLTVSGQLEAETFALAYKKTYTFGPTFRAENSNTKTHASEFWMIEPEIAFCDLEGDMNITESSYRLLSHEELLEFAREGATKSAELVIKSHLSLAGASGKTGLYYDRNNNEWYQPAGLAPSTHILKQSHVRLKKIVANEQLCLLTARKLGIRTPDSFIINLNDKEDDFLFATERYDRKILDTSKELMGKKVPLRLHQEDFAQALGITASRKYEKNGERLFSRCI